MFLKIRNAYGSLSNSAKAAFATAFFAFVSTLATAVTGVLQEFIDYVNDNGPEPNWDGFAKVAISGFVTLVIAIFNYITRKVQHAQDPTSGPKYSK